MYRNYVSIPGVDDDVNILIDQVTFYNTNDEYRQPNTVIKNAIRMKQY